MRHENALFERNIMRRRLWLEHANKLLALQIRGMAGAMEAMNRRDRLGGDGEFGMSLVDAHHAEVGVAPACSALAVSRATWHRRRAGRGARRCAPGSRTGHPRRIR